MRMRIIWGGALFGGCTFFSTSFTRQLSGNFCVLCFIPVQFQAMCVVEVP